MPKVFNDLPCTENTEIPTEAHQDHISLQTSFCSLPIFSVLHTQINLWALLPSRIFNQAIPLPITHQTPNNAVIKQVLYSLSVPLSVSQRNISYSRHQVMSASCHSDYFAQLCLSQNQLPHFSLPAHCLLISLCPLQHNSTAIVTPTTLAVNSSQHQFLCTRLFKRNSLLWKFQIWTKGKRPHTQPSTELLSPRSLPATLHPCCDIWVAKWRKHGRREKPRPRMFPDLWGVL